MASSDPALTVLVPLRDEEDRLPDSLERLLVHARSRGDTEIVLAVDAGSKDRTEELARSATRDHPEVRWVAGEVPGKGATIASALTSCRGRSILMADVDLAVDPSDFERLQREAATGAVAIASRNMPGARRLHEPLTRKLMGRLFNLAVRALVLPGVKDTQCGYKAFPATEVEALFHELRTKKWVFDVELLARARLKGLRVVEVPVTWTYGAGSRLKLFADLPDIVRELLRVRRTFGRVRSAGPVAAAVAPEDPRPRADRSRS